MGHWSYKPINSHIHTVGDFLPAVFPAFGNCKCVAFSLCLTSYLSNIIVCKVCHSAANRLVMFVIGHILQTPPLLCEPALG